MNILKISFTIILILLYSKSLSSQTNIDIFKSSMKDCNIRWLKEKHKNDIFEVVLDSMPNHEEIIRFKLINDITILNDYQSVCNYIKDVYYNDLEILSGDYFSKTDKTGLILYTFVIKNEESAPKLDKHTVKNICGSYYLISYFSMYGISEEVFNKYECMNSIIEYIKCF